MVDIGEKILKNFFFNYLILNEIDEIEKMISEKFKGVGTSKFEVARSKKEFITSIEIQIKNLNGKKLSFYISNYTEDYFENIISSYCEVTIIHVYTKEERLVTRLTTIFMKENDEWKIINMHNSIAEVLQNKEEIFPNNLILDNNEEIELYLSSKSKRISFKLKDVNYIIYSSSNRTASFYLQDLKKFDIRRNFSDVEIKIKNLTYLYKLDRGTIINKKKIEMLDFTEEKIIFENKQELYVSKMKLRELEKIWIKDKNKIDL